jgi:hypothetical protein
MKSLEIDIFMPKDEPFSALNIPVMRYINNEESIYDVYTDKNTFVTVKADTAAEAIEKSGIAEPYKLFHNINSIKTILGDNEIILYKQEQEPFPPTIT